MALPLRSVFVHNQSTSSFGQRTPPVLLCLALSGAAGCSSHDNTDGIGGSLTDANSARGGAGTGQGGNAMHDGSSMAASGGADGGRIDPAPGDAPTKTLGYTESTSTLINPERGFYATGNLAAQSDFAKVRSNGRSLLYGLVHLDAYLGTNHDQPLPQALFDDVQRGFDAVRAAGLKTVVRFEYDNGEGYPTGANDANETWMLQHIASLGPVLHANEDVIFVLQAGFIGAWGEWHTSKNFTDGLGDVTPRKAIVDGLLAALPATRRIAVRYPAYKRAFYGTTPTSQDDLLAGRDISRVGHHNDCFVSGPDDVGTYQYAPMAVLKAYLESDTAYVPIGGETCAVDPRNSCSITLAEMERFHYSYINSEFNPDVLAVWDSQGCRPEIERRLGYRLVLVKAELPSAVKPGGSFSFDLELRNDGFAALTNQRPVFLVLESDRTRLITQLTDDPRLWLPGSFHVRARVRVPANLPSGSYRLALWLPDAASGLRARSEYSVQLANDAVWNSATGDNSLSDIEISQSAAGTADPNATALELL